MHSNSLRRERDNSAARRSALKTKRAQGICAEIGWNHAAASLLGSCSVFAVLRYFSEIKGGGGYV